MTETSRANGSEQQISSWRPPLYGTDEIEAIARQAA